MRRTIWVHVYVPAGATPEVANDINGRATPVDEDEIKRNPEAVRQKLIDDFINWLKGKPEGLREYAQIEGGKGDWGEGETVKENYILEAKQRIAQKRPVAVVGESKGSRVTMGKWKGRDAWFVRNVKTGRFEGWGLK